MAEILRYTLSNPHRLPVGYTPVAWIQSANDCLINTGIIPDSTFLISFTFGDIEGITNNLQFAGSGISAGICFTKAPTGFILYSRYTSPLTFGNTKYLKGKHRIFCSTNFMLIDDSLISNLEISATLATEPFYLFSSRPGLNNGSCKIYTCQIWLNGQLVRDFIPCFNSTLEAGLFDIVNNLFYSSVGSGTFTAGPEIKSLPYEYQQVEYLENPLDAFIDTGYLPTVNYRVIFKGLSNSTGYSLYGRFFGSGKHNAANGFNIDFENYPTGTLHVKYLGTTAWTINSSVHGDYNIHEYDMNNSRVLIDGVEVSTNTSTATAVAPAYNLGLFSYVGTGKVATENWHGKCYSCQVYDGETLVCDFVPCYKRDGVVPGMYDLVRKTFYSNAGTGNFVLGPSMLELPIQLEHNVLSGNINYLTGDLTSERSLIRSSSNTSTDYDYVTYLKSLKLYNGSTDISSQLKWTFTAEVKGSTSGILTDFYFRNTEGTIMVTSLTVTLTTEYKRYYYHFTGSPANADICRFRVKSDGTVTIKNVRLYPGHDELPWYPLETGIPTNVNSSTEHPNGNHNLPIEYQETTYVKFTPGAYLNTNLAIAVGDNTVTKAIMYYEAGETGRDLMGWSSTSAEYWGVTAAGAWEKATGGNSNITVKQTVSRTYTAVAAGSYTIGSVGGVGATYAVRTKYIYSFKITVNDVLKRDLIPCFRKSDSVAGMYDLVTKTFYAATAGSLCNGPYIERTNGCTQFNGNSNSMLLINAPAIDLSGNVTVSAWVKFDEITNGEMLITILDGDHSLSANIGLNGTSCWQAIRFTTTLYKGVQRPSIEAVANKWTHVVAIFNSTTGADLYINGALLQAGNKTITYSSENTGKAVRIGRGVKGCMYDLRVWNEALSADKIKEIYNNTI